jgi:hypothetical protein
MFRWKRGLLHALIPFGLAIAGGLALLVVKEPVDPEKLGEGVGRFAFFMLLAGLGISYLAQTGRKKAAWLAALALVGGIGALAAVLATAHGPRRVHAADRAPLVDDGVRLRHPTFGFSILRPPASYHEAPQIAAAMGIDDPDTVTYAYAETPPRGGLVIAIIANAALTKADFTRAIAGIRHGMDKAMAAQANTVPGAVHWLRDEVSGDDAHLVGHLHAEVNQLDVRITAVSLPSAIVTITVLAQDATTLADVLESLQP